MPRAKKTIENVIEVTNANLFYGKKQALKNINMNFEKGSVVAIIGPSGCGKSTFLRCINRMNDHIPGIKIRGRFIYHDYDIYAEPGSRTKKLKKINKRIIQTERKIEIAKDTAKISSLKDKLKILKKNKKALSASKKEYRSIHETELRKRIGMIFQKPNPFPMSIEKNIQYGPRVNGISSKSTLEKITKKSLEEAGLWEEVKDRLWESGESLSGGQQQRLCIARAVANDPEILLMDEPTSALDPIAAEKIEELIKKLKGNYTIVIVTHSLAQAKRIADYTAFFYEGELIEFSKTKNLFENPKMEKTKEYIQGRFG